MGLSNAAAVASNGQVIAYAAGTCLVVSFDGGSTWNSNVGPVISSGLNDCELVAVTNNGQVILVYVQYQGIYTSLNSGSTWTLSYSNTIVNSVGSIVCSGNICYAGTQTSSYEAIIIKSTDYGQTWTASNPLKSDVGVALTIAPSVGMSSDGQIIAATSSLLFYSSNGGQSYQQKSESSFNGVVAVNGDGTWSIWSDGEVLENVYVGNIGKFTTAIIVSLAF